ncbi:universal stress protein [Mycobacterium sp. IDR2000157661]|uniref:universal stress protein n=1 Tax=Mycobacterium sp. IDR2000157661 TaxID=2867005 RepID=UPI001EEA3E2D|nr:universal stress protein [Mycobacterium sp. IDR2000157661]ULE33416.1 universal stress protein [Mycobacterium sp. IDR2000157661]
MPERKRHRGIVVGADGSVPSQAAVRWAAREATMRDLPLTIMHANRVSEISASVLMWPAGRIPQEVLALQEDEARKIISDAVGVAREYTAPRRLEVDTETFLGGPVPTLIDLSKDAQLVVVGSRGRSAFNRALLGSVSSGVIHHSHCPVAVIHDEAPPSDNLPVLVGIDGSRASEAATAIAFDEASWRGVELIALHVWSDADLSEFSMDWETVHAAASKTLAERLAGWHERYPDVAVRKVVEFQQPAHHLVKLSKQAQLVVVGSHGRGGFAGMLLGSVGSAVVQAARVPVIVARQT